MRAQCGRRDAGRLNKWTANWLSDDGETRNNFPVDLLVIRSLIEIIFAPNRVLGLMDELNEQPPLMWTIQRRSSRRR